MTEVLRGSRVTEFRVDVLDRSDRLVGPLEGVSGGELSWSASAAVKGGGRLNVTKLPGGVPDWLKVRLRPVARIWSPDEAPDVLEVPLGVFLPSVPAHQVDGDDVTVTVELLDKTAVLDEDVIGAPVAVGAAGSIGQTYVLRKGFNIVQAVKNIIAQSGETTPAIVVPTPAKVLPADMVWEAGTSRLTVINDLLDIAGYQSLWCDGDGRYRTGPYVKPANRPRPYDSLGPFQVGATSLMGMQVGWERDLYRIPNRVLVVGQGDGDAPALKALATNTDPTSPLSSVARGRWVTHVESGVEAASQAELNAYAARRLAQLSAPTSRFQVAHLLLPALTVGSPVRVGLPQLGAEVLAVVMQTTIPLDPLALCTSVLEQVTT